MFELTEDQQFELEKLKKGVGKLTRDQLEKRLIKLFALNMALNSAFEELQ